jgi:hypothetical protein
MYTLNPVRPAVRRAVGNLPRVSYGVGRPLRRVSLIARAKAVPWETPSADGSKDYSAIANEEVRASGDGIV